MKGARLSIFDVVEAFVVESRGSKRTIYGSRSERKKCSFDMQDKFEAVFGVSTKDFRSAPLSAEN